MKEKTEITRYPDRMVVRQRSSLAGPVPTQVDATEDGAEDVVGEVGARFAWAGLASNAATIVCGMLTAWYLHAGIFLARPGHIWRRFSVQKQ